MDYDFMTTASESFIISYWCLASIFQYAHLRFTDNVTFSVNVTIDHLAAGMGTIESPTYASAITKCKDVVADTVPDTLYETTVASHLAKFFVPGKIYQYCFENAAFNYSNAYNALLFTKDDSKYFLH